MSADSVQIVITDVDGVLTDGSIGLDAKGGEILFFSVVDGMGIRLLQDAGIAVGFVSSRESPMVEARASVVGVRIRHAGVKDKRSCLEGILAREGIPAARACYVGDDLVDLGCLRLVGFPVAVANARDEVKREARYITSASGGRGAFREVAEHILKAQGRWETSLETFA